MSVNSKDFLDFAADSLTRGDEIGFRNAVARSYYAMFHEVRSMLSSLPNFTSHAHDGLISYLTQPDKSEQFDKMALRALAAMLRQQKGKRAIADYDVNNVVSESDAKESIRMAEKLFQKCEDMRNPAKSA